MKDGILYMFLPLSEFNCTFSRDFIIFSAVSIPLYLNTF